MNSRPYAQVTFLSLLFAAGAVHADAPRKVQVEICERGIPEKPEWPKATPPADERYEADALAFFRVPFKYIDTGIRADRGTSYLLRATAEVAFPAGEHRILLLTRGACKISIA